MVHVILMCCALIGQDGAPAVSPSADRAVYESAQAKAGERPDAHVQLALWCEAHGLSAERVKHLALAVAYDPSHALARGLMGLVPYQGKWGRPEVIGQEIQNDPVHKDVIREYLDRRVKTDSNPKAQLRLAAWCEQNGLKEQALAHYSEVIRLDPSREDVWRHLGYKRQGNRWQKAEEIDATRQEAGRQRQADKHWKLVFESLRSDLESENPAKRARAERRLTEVTDPRAVPMIWAHFVRGSEWRELVAVQMLGQIDSPSASGGLAAMAVFSPRQEVRRRSTETLARYDPRDVVEGLIDVIHKPFMYQVRPSSGPGSVGELFVEGERYNIDRFYQNQVAVPSLWGGRLFAPSISFNPFSNQNLTTTTPGGRPQLMDLELQAQQDIGVRYQLQRFREDDQGLQRRLARDVQTVEASNARIRRLNDRALAVLTTITGHNLGEDPENWKSWWTDQLGYSYRSSQPEIKPTYTSIVSQPILPPPVPSAPHHSCFGAGTLVRTTDGPRAIESIQVGDLLLSQNTMTGSMEFQPVVAVYHNKPAATVRLAIGGDRIVATGIHRFWKAGKGWTMARELKAGDRLRAVGGVAEIQSVETDTVQPVFNLEVAGNRDFFVGRQGMLVHDNSFVQPVLEPFDRQPDLAALTPASN